ncbi:MAG: enolase C-terminal domain-like protein [Haloarculaceae archaeon]
MAGGGEDGTDDGRTEARGPDGEANGRGAEGAEPRHDCVGNGTGDRVGSLSTADVSVEPYSLPLSRPLSTARGTIESRRGFLVRVRTEGAVGVGEAAPLPDFTESYEACEATLATASDHAADEGLDAAHHAIDADAHPAAAHGLAAACLDAVGKAVDQPLYRLLGGEDCGRIPVNAVVGDGDPDQTADRAAAAVEGGFDCVKVKVGAREPAADAARLRAVRTAIGSAPTLRADANGAWSRGQAEAAMEAFDGLDLQYVEQPLPRGDLQGCGALRDGPVPIAIDEGLTVHGVDEVLAARAADAIVVKPMVHGSPAAALAVATAALDAGLTATVTTTVDAVVARTAAVHVAGSLPEVTAAGLATAARLTADLGPDPAPVTDGTIAVPQEPGLGVGEVST